MYDYLKDMLGKWVCVTYYSPNVASGDEAWGQLTRVLNHGHYVEIEVSGKPLPIGSLFTKIEVLHD